jgi:hypothetical protein
MSKEIFIALPIATLHGIEIIIGIPLLISKHIVMEPRKDGSNQNLEERNRDLSSDYEQVNNEGELDTTEVSTEIEEGDEDYDDEELTEDDFEVDEEEDEEEEIE